MMATTTTSGPVNHENIPPTNSTTTTTYKAISCSSSSCSSSDLVSQQQQQANNSDEQQQQLLQKQQEENTYESVKPMEVTTSQEIASDDKPKTNGTNGTTNGSDSTTKKDEKKKAPPAFKIEIPRISSSRDLRPQKPHSPTRTELLEQVGFLLNGSGADRDLNKTLTKIRSVELEEAVKKARKYAMEQSVRYALVKQQQQQQKQQLDLIKKQQAILLMCRIYVGSIFYEVREEQVRSSFGQFGPIRSISMSWDAVTNKHKGFAFIEFETPEAAQLSLDQMNGSLMGGRNIKVGRPSNMPQAQPIIDALIEDAKRYHRIYISSIHPELSEQDVKSVFEAFGTIKTCGLARDLQTGKHKGYGFIEYYTAQAAQDAINSMNLFDLGGQLLRVGKAITPPETVTPPNSNLLNQPFGGYAGAAAAATNAISALNPTMGISIPSLAASGALNTPGLASKLSEITSGGSFSNLTQLNTGASSSITNSSSATTLSSKASSSNLSADAKPETSQQSISAQLNTIAQQVTIQMNNSAVLNSIAAQCQSPAVLQAQAVAAAAVASATGVVVSTASTSTPVSVNTPSAVSTTSANESAAAATAGLGGGGGGGGDGTQLTEGQRKLLGLGPGEEVVTTLEQQSELTVKSKEQRLILMKKLMSRQPESRVVVLRNMVGPEDVDDELETEITDECEKFGQVEKAIIYQEKQGEEEDAEVIVKIFVEFVSPKSVEAAVSALNGRYFAGRRVRAEVYDQMAYDSKDYSG